MRRFPAALNCNNRFKSMCSRKIRDRRVISVDQALSFFHHNHRRQLRSGRPDPNQTINGLFEDSEIHVAWNSSVLDSLSETANEVTTAPGYILQNGAFRGIHMAHQANRIEYLPLFYELGGPPCTIRLMAEFLDCMVYQSDSKLRGTETITVFHAKSPPEMSAGDYLKHITIHGSLTPAVLLAMMVCLRKLGVVNTRFRICSLTVHRLLLACATIASKGICDFAFQIAFTRT